MQTCCTFICLLTANLLRNMHVHATIMNEGFHNEYFQSKRVKYTDQLKKKLCQALNCVLGGLCNELVIFREGEI